MDEKIRFTTDVIAEMKAVISDNEKLNQLHNCLVMHLADFDMKEKPKGEVIVYNEDKNAQWLKYFIAAKTVEGLSPKTLKYYSSEIRNLSSNQHNRPFDEITSEIIYYDLAYRKKKSGCSDCNLNNIRRIYSTFFGWLHANEYIKRNPMLKVKKIKAEKKVKEPLSYTEIEMIRDTIQNIRDRAILEIFLSSGMRVGEIVGLDRKDVDIEHKRVMVLGKGNKQRWCYLNEKSIYRLKKYIETRDDDNPALFVSLLQPHDRLQIPGVEIMIREAGREAGIKSYPHKLRRTAATNALRKGMRLEQVQKMLGHESPETTLIYARMNDDDLQQAHTKLME